MKTMQELLTEAKEKRVDFSECVGEVMTGFADGGDCVVVVFGDNYAAVNHDSWGNDSIMSIDCDDRIDEIDLVRAGLIPKDKYEAVLAAARAAATVVQKKRDRATLERLTRELGEDFRDHNGS